ncbi:MAG: fabH [Acidimicrobiales bacterium]|nr:fabH [Acidimicrobiales bacterium]
MQGATITGWGTALPGTVLGNDELARRFGTTPAWIEERTGIVERRVGGTTTDLATEAGAAALARAGAEPGSVDLLLLATTTPDRAMPATASVVQAKLGLSGGAVDVNAACAGFVYALVAGFGHVAVGARRVLVIGAEVMTRLVDPADRGTAVLFGDGAGAVLLDAVDGPGGLLVRRAVRTLVASSSATLDRAGRTPGDVALFVPHQANARIVEAATARLGIPPERTALSMARTGNTSAASVPLALAAAADDGRLADGDLVLFSGYGAGMTWASALVRWSG